MTATPQTASQAPTTDRCTFSDLPVGQCGCVHCRPDLVETGFVPGADGAFIPVQHVGTWREAAYPGTCGCGCEQRFGERAEIILADLADDGDGWCLVDHTRSPFSGGH